MVIETREEDIYNYENDINDSSLPPMASWVDEDHQPQDYGDFLVTVVRHSPTNSEGTIRVTTLAFAIPTCKSAYSFFLAEKEKCMLREQDKESFTTFLSTIRRSKEGPSSVLGQVEIPEVSNTILSFVLGP